MSKSEHILDVAETLFNQFGYSAVGVDLIRDHARVSKTSMYRHFGSKNKLIEAVLIRRHQRFENTLGKAVIAGSSTEEKLNALLDWHFAWFREADFKGCMFMHAFAEFKYADRLLADRAQQHKAWLKALIACAFDVDEARSEVCTSLLLTWFEGLIVTAEFGDIDADRELYRSGMHALAATRFPTYAQ
ncbi:TetR family transcriptional regulator [Erwinia sp. E602]|uniref:TetR/AcrR family transcriptional regulator n=1 Tax=Erwinia sp. E602 TaxID=2675378 RepID=UPI001BEDEF78|nr:TetR/AcrR family transcriptional regulator [Erwinia sp. E602]QUG74545.1 TetR family transcriptional regulator [Erwinia sp. E602]